MDFKKCDSGVDKHVGVLLPHFSVAVMSDEARYEWSHGITPRLADIVRSSDSSHASQSQRLTLLKRGVRTSLTFRNVRHSAVCHCSMYLKTLQMTIFIARLQAEWVVLSGMSILTCCLNVSYTGTRNM